jgi:hypothetical protein
MLHTLHVATCALVFTGAGALVIGTFVTTVVPQRHRIFGLLAEAVAEKR